MFKDFLNTAIETRLIEKLTDDDLTRIEQTIFIERTRRNPPRGMVGRCGLNGLENHTHHPEVELSPSAVKFWPILDRYLPAYHPGNDGLLKSFNGADLSRTSPANGLGFTLKYYPLKVNKEIDLNSFMDINHGMCPLLPVKKKLDIIRGLSRIYLSVYGSLVSIDAPQIVTEVFIKDYQADVLRTYKLSLNSGSVNHLGEPLNHYHDEGRQVDLLATLRLCYTHVGDTQTLVVRTEGLDIIDPTVPAGKYAAPINAMRVVAFDLDALVKE